jgi:hypothetical protein
MTKGYIYCLSNPSFKPNLYKIGYTTMNLNKRINALYKTGVPTKFVINFAKTVKQCRLTEHDIHNKLKKMRINPSREFFKCPLPNIKSVFDKIEGVWWKEDDVDDVKKEKKVPTPVFKSKRTKRFRKVKQYKFNYKV